MNAAKFCRVGCTCGQTDDAFPVRLVTVNYYGLGSYGASWQCRHCGAERAVSVDTDTAEALYQNGATKRDCQASATATLIDEVEKFLGAQQ